MKSTKKTPYAISDWNKRVLDEADFYEICEKKKIAVLNLSIRSKGEYLVYKDQAFIILKPGMPRSLRVWVQFHELAHALLHTQINSHFSTSTLRKLDTEANHFAALALMPTPLLREYKYDLDEISADYNYDAELIEIRKEIFETYRI